MENFDNFYKNSSIEELKKFLETKRLNQSNLYDFLIGYTDYLKKQKDLDSF